jgi:hypothetical protein
MISQDLLWPDIETFIHKSFVLTWHEHYYQLETRHLQENSWHLKFIIRFMIIFISYLFLFMHFRSTEEFNEVWGSPLFYSQFCLACMFTAGLFQTAMVNKTHVNWEIRDKWLPVTTAWRFLSLRIEERPLIWRVATNILNKQLRTAGMWWSSNLGFGRSVDNFSP